LYLVTTRFAPGDTTQLEFTFKEGTTIKGNVAGHIKNIAANKLLELTLDLSAEATTTDEATKTISTMVSAPKDKAVIELFIRQRLDFSTFTDDGTNLTYTLDKSYYTNTWKYVKFERAVNMDKKDPEVSSL
jgi:hypothetical protein